MIVDPVIGPLRRQVLSKNTAPAQPLRLVHYSRRPDLTSVDPDKMGTGAPSAEYRQGLPDVPRSYWYEEGSQPEGIVVQGARGKYQTQLAPEERVYDIGTDPEGHARTARQRFLAGDTGGNSSPSDAALAAIRAAGHVGYRNSRSALPNVVGLFHSRRAEQVPLESPLRRSEALVKRSKNVREQTRNITTEQAHQRIAGFLRRLSGFRVEGKGRDRFGMGRDQRGVTYNPTQTEDPLHEVAHALHTPPGQTLREHQQALGNQTTRRPEMEQQARRAEEGSAYNMEPLLARRAGIGIAPSAGTTFRYHWQRGPRAHLSDMAEGRAAARQVLGAFEVGGRMISPQGQVEDSSGLNARINTRQPGAMGKAEPWPALERAKRNIELRRQLVEAGPRPLHFDRSGQNMGPIVVHPDTTAQGRWRATRFDQHMQPVGHFGPSTFEESIKAAHLGGGILESARDPKMGKSGDVAPSSLVGQAALAKEFLIRRLY